MWGVSASTVVAQTPAELQTNDPRSPAPEPMGNETTVASSTEDSCKSCSQDSVLMQRLDVLAAEVRAERDDPWQDAKSVVLNIISNRLDELLFGGAKGNVGIVPLIVAIVAVVIAAIRFVMACALLRSAVPPTGWGRFKTWIRQSGVVRAANVVVGALAVLFTAGALYVVMEARAAPDITRVSVAALENSLRSCQTKLANTSVQSAPASHPPPSKPDISHVDAMNRLSESCDVTARANSDRLTSLHKSVAEIEAKQPWTLTKIIGFLAMAYLLYAATVFLLRDDT